MKKYITTVSFAKIAVLVFMLFTTLVNAQTDLPDAPEDELAAPIDDYVLILALTGIMYVILRIRDFAQQANSEE
jgi:hypothetical protein